MRKRYNAQEAYEGMREWFSRPNAEFGYDHAERMCVYRLDGDPTSLVRCAYGSLIPDEVYDPVSENLTVSSDDLPKPMQLWANEDAREFMTAAQSKHDYLARYDKTTDEFVRGLDDLAAEYGLTVIES